MLNIGYSGYQELNALPPEAFLKWEDFRTAFDVSGDAYSQEQYAKGLEIGRQSKLCGPRLMGDNGQGAVYIRANGTWAADVPPSVIRVSPVRPDENDEPTEVCESTRMAGFCSSYEGIGYHRSTADLLRGFIDSGAKIVVSRLYPGKCIERTVIQELKESTDG